MTATAPLVSCVLLTFNHERWVRDALDSILGQPHPAGRLQVVAVDNGSTDATVEILEAYGDRVEVHALDGGSLNDALNVGLARIDGDFFTVFSGDDVWTPDRLPAMLEVFAERPGVGLVYGDMEVIDGDGALLHRSWRELNGVPVDEGDLLGRLLERNAVFGPAMLVRGTLKPAIAPIPPQAAWEDWWFASTVARLAEIAYLPFPVTRYRRHGAALSNVDTAEKEARFLREDLRFRGWLLQNASAGDASPEEIVTAVLAQLDGVARLAELTSRPLASAAGVSAGDQRRARAAARAARSLTDPHARLAGLARAVGHDPTDIRLGRELSAAAGAAEAADAGHVLGPVDPAWLLDGARARITLLRLEDLSPALLARYAERVGPDDDATLALFAPDGDAGEVAALVDGALAEAGVDPERAPDMLLVGLPDTPAVRAALAVRAHALLSDAATVAWPFAGLPRVDAVLVG
ncbi:MAG TPA: glycosyltransferase [Solirubrobacteraceae bacterium]